MEQKVKIENIRGSAKCPHCGHVDDMHIRVESHLGYIEDNEYSYYTLYAECPRCKLEFEVVG